MNPASGRDHIPPARLLEGLARFIAERAGPPSGFSISPLEWLGEGRFYAAFSFSLGNGGPWNGDYVVRILKPAEEEEDAVERLARSTELLRRLDGAGGLAPRCLGSDERGEYLGRPMTVELRISGLVLSWEFGSATRWAGYAGMTLARLHAVPLTPAITSLFPAAEDFATEMLRRAESRVNRLGRVPLPIEAGLERARRVSLFGSVPVLIHGDPQIHNIIHPQSGGECSLIDWEFSRTGVREYDLAVFLRGDEVVDDTVESVIRPVMLTVYHSWMKCLSPESYVAGENIRFFEILLNIASACTFIEQGDSISTERQLDKLTRLSLGPES
ncbi:MAG: phosphotransferase [Planctomycetes bacterium]|nr:phosphotransferase [Planctomycetota bacterium]